jgi:hypothetical protein
VQTPTIRRMFSSGGMNPALGTLAEVAAVLGLRVSVGGPTVAWVLTVVGWVYEELIGVGRQAG